MKSILNGILLAASLWIHTLNLLPAAEPAYEADVCVYQPVEKRPGRAIVG